MGLSPGGGGAISRRLIPHTKVHSETVGNHPVTGGIPKNLRSLHQGGEEDGDDPDDEMVGSGRGTRI